MRKITEEVRNAFLNRRSKTIGNTSTDGTALFLHNNLIAIHNGDNSITINNAGWFSNTTKERLNALPNVNISQKKGIWYLNGEAWNGKAIKINI